MSISGSRREEEARVARAHAAFEAAMQEASEEALWFLHAALEKRCELLRRGDWGRAPEEEGAAGRGSVCPLAALALGRLAKGRGELDRAARITEDQMARHGFRSSDFYEVWDGGLLSASELLRRVDRHLTARVLGRRRRV